MRFRIANFVENFSQKVLSDLPYLRRSKYTRNDFSQF
jgi:hypothetical protein